MKIKQITAHLIESDLCNLASNYHGPYTRIVYPEGIFWYAGNDVDIRLVYHKSLQKALETEFQETYGIMHEQLELIYE